MTSPISQATSPLQHAIDMNNRAASFMVTGENSQGLLCFQATIRAMKEASAADFTHSKMDSIHVTESSHRMMKPCPKALLQQVQQHAYVYDHQFLFEDSTCEHIDNETVLALYSGTMLFNFGLALHTDGLVSGKDSYLKKALYIYDMALYLLRPCARCETFASVIAVILNNVANIYFNLGEFSDAERQFSKLGEILQTMYWPLRRLLSAPVVDELFVNTLVCQRPCASSAA